MLYLPPRFCFKIAWKNISPLLTEMYLVVWGNTLLLQSPKTVLMTFDIDCTSSPSGCWCVWAQILTEGRGKKSGNSFLSCDFSPPCSSQCFLSAGGVAPQGGWACLSMPVPNTREVFAHLDYFSIPEIKIKDTADGISPLSLPISLPWMVCVQVI